jgi:hypothetical protein
VQAILHTGEIHHTLQLVRGGEMTLIQLWTRAVFKRDNNLCQRCLSQGKIVSAVDAHHIIHKDRGYLRYLLNNGVALCRQCHDLDSQGKLLKWCIEFVGEEQYYRMKREGHASVAGDKFDEDAAREELTKYLEETINED